MEQCGLTAWAYGYTEQVSRFPNGGSNMLADLSVRSGSDRQDLLPEYYELENTQYHGPEMDSFLYDSFASLDQQLVSAPQGSLQPSHSELQQINPPLVNLIHNGLQPYNVQPPMEHWTNRELLSMLRDWQDFIYSGEERCALEHPDFQEVMAELIRRNIVSVTWRWTVNIEEVDMALTRAVVEGSRV